MASFETILDGDLGEITTSDSIVIPSTYPVLYPDGNKFEDTHNGEIWVVMEDSHEFSVLGDIPPDHELALYLQEAGIADLLDIPFRSLNINLNYPKLKFSVPYSAYRWARAHNIVENKPFKLRIYVRFYTSHSFEGDEGDVEIHVDFLSQLKRTAKVRKYWSKEAKYLHAYVQRCKKEITYNFDQMLGQLDLLYIQIGYSNYREPEFTFSLKSTFDGMQNGLPTRMPFQSIATGKGCATKELAFQSLSTVLQETYPQLYSMLSLADKPLASLPIKYSH